MAANLLGRGFPLSVFDLDRRRVGALEAQGARAAASARDLGAASQMVLTSLPSSSHVEDALTGPDGAMAAMAPGGIVVDLSTIDPNVTRRLAARAAERGLFMLDAPVSGAPPKARDGTLTIMVGGDAAVVARARPVLEALGSNVLHVGAIGAGEVVKLVNNLIAAVNMAAVAEAFNLGVRSGVDPRVLHDVVTKSSGDCWVLRTRVPYPDVTPDSPANDGFQPGFTVDLMHKDLGLVLEASKAVDAPTVLGAVVEQMYRATRARGRGGLDFSAVATVIQELSGGAVGVPEGAGVA